MLFTEARYYIWLGLSILAFWAAPRRSRALVLLIISCAFWLLSSLHGSAWLAGAFLVTWFGGNRIETSPPESRQRLAWLRVSCIILIAGLVIAKFGARMFPSFTPLIAGQGSLGGLPLGISYYTFHCLGYLLDLFWSKEKPMKSSTLGLYLTFFPKAVMGPIARSGQFQQQTSNLPEIRWAPAEVVPACLQICIGLFMKFVLADRMMLFVNGYFAAPEKAPIPGLLGAAMFCWQLYYDFFGYSLIAVGVGRLFGFKLPNNFSRPFFVTSISDFWSRWHISLSSWFLEYFYTPLRFRLRRRRNLALIVAGMTTFVSIGIWHGTGWTFVILGVVHGILVTSEALYPKLRQAPRAFPLVAARMLLTFVIIAATLVLFRASDLAAAGDVYRRFLMWSGKSAGAITDLLPKFDWLVFIGFATIAEVLTWKGFIAGDGDGGGWIMRVPSWLRIWIFGTILALTWAFGMFGKTTFLYNQF